MLFVIHYVIFVFSCFVVLFFVILLVGSSSPGSSLVISGGVLFMKQNNLLDFYGNDYDCIDGDGLYDKLKADALHFWSLPHEVYNFFDTIEKVEAITLVDIADALQEAYPRIGIEDRYESYDSIEGMLNNYLFYRRLSFVNMEYDFIHHKAWHMLCDRYYGII